MTPIFAPSILSFNPLRLQEPLAELMRAGADWIHCDVMDGQFVPPITFGADLIKKIAECGQTPREAHLMTLTPELHFPKFIDAGCKRIIFHAEATAHAYRLAQTLRSEGVQAGIAINPGTPVEMLEPLLDAADLVLIMTVNPGWGGQQFLSSCLRKVERIRALSSDIHIEVDGGIDTITIREAQCAGANVFVMGSFLADAASPAEGLMELRTACASK